MKQEAGKMPALQPEHAQNRFMRFSSRLKMAYSQLISPPKD